MSSSSSGGKKKGDDIPPKDMSGTGAIPKKDPRVSSKDSSDKDSSKGSKGSTRSGSSKKTVEDHFGSEVDVKIRTATGNPKVQAYFGSEVDIKLRTAENPLDPNLKLSNPKPPKAPKPTTIDLAAIDAKPFKELTDIKSLAKLEEKLGEVVKAKEADPSGDKADPSKPGLPGVKVDAFGAKPNPAGNKDGKVKDGMSAEDTDQLGKKVSAMFLAQVEIAEDDKDKEEKRKRVPLPPMPHPSYLDSLPTRSPPNFSQVQNPSEVRPKICQI